MGYLHSFSSYTNTAPVIPVLVGQVGQTTNFPCSLVNLDGNAAAVGWWQVFDLADAAGLVSGTTIPLKSIKVSAAGSLPSITNALGAILLFNGLCVAMSSTEAVYTAVATGFDVYGEISEFEVDNTVGSTVVGDLTTARTSLTVWANDADGDLKTLKRLYIKNNTGADGFIVISSTTTLPASASGIPLRGLIPIAAGQEKNFSFGTSGSSVSDSSAAGVITQGCYIQFLTSTGGYCDFGTAVNGIKAKAWYSTAS